MNENPYCYLIYENFHYLQTLKRFKKLPPAIERRVQEVRKTLKRDIKRARFYAKENGWNFAAQMLNDPMIQKSRQKRAIMEKSAHRKNKTKWAIK